VGKEIYNRETIRQVIRVKKRVTGSREEAKKREI
jgi:hypothetical protein